MCMQYKILWTLDAVFHYGELNVQEHYLHAQKFFFSFVLPQLTNVSTNVKIPLHYRMEIITINLGWKILMNSQLGVI